MDFGIFLAPAADSWKIVARAEELGYRRAWFYDTQLLNAELFVAMAAAAMRTSTIRLGTGVLIPSNRIAPVAASGLASLNALAPGRIDFGISTGFTARRTMGLRPVKLALVEEYVRIVRGLLAGQTLEWTFEDKRRKIRFLNPEIGAINVTDPIPVHVAATGPRARRLAAKLGAGWLHATAGVAHAQAGIADMQAAWRDTGRAVGELHATATISGCVLGGARAGRQSARQGSGRAYRHHRASQPGRAGGVRRYRPASAAASRAALGALSPDLSCVRAGRRPLLAEPPRAPDVPAPRGAGDLHGTADSRDHLHRAAGRTARADPRARAGGIQPRRADCTLRPPRNARGVGRGVRGRVTPLSASRIRA